MPRKEDSSSSTFDFTFMYPKKTDNLKVLWSEYADQIIDLAYAQARKSKGC